MGNAGVTVGFFKYLCDLNMGTTISREKENRIQKKMREAGQIKSAVEGFKHAGRKTSNTGQATTGKSKPWKFPFQKR